MPVIRIDDDVYAWLQQIAVPFDDTPNTVLRRIAKLDKLPLPREEPKTNENESEYRILPKKPAKYLARLWKINVVHSLYHKEGTYYNHLQYFPGALLDAKGYVIFRTETEYRNSPYLQHGKQLHVHGGIFAMPTYNLMDKGFLKSQQ